MFPRLVMFCALLVGGALVPVQAATVSKPSGVRATHATTVYKTVEIDGLKIFYREAGPPKAPTVLLLHGFPSSSRMFEPFIPLLADRYHVIAPDYPGFGHSDAPPPGKFTYTFANITTVIDKFTQTLGLSTYALYVTDYGGAVGMRLATAHPERVSAIIVQNAAVHDDALEDPRWASRKAFWGDRAAHEEQIREGMLAAEGARTRHLGSSPHPDRYNPDQWDAEVAYMSKPGMVEIALDLSYDYRTNVAASRPGRTICAATNRRCSSSGASTIRSSRSAKPTRSGASFRRPKSTSSRPDISHSTRRSTKSPR